MSFSKCAVLAISLGISLTTALSHLDHAERAYFSLQSTYYDDLTGLWNSDGNWWCDANTLTTICNLASISTKVLNSAESIIANTFITAQSTYPNFLNGFYDDEGWWALGWLAAYNITSDPSYLAMAETIFADMTCGWNDAGCYNGGIWWQKPDHCVNAIENELFLQVAAELALTDSKNSDYYLSWAEIQWNWFASTGLINSNNTINDGLNTKTCQNNGGRIWSYNQGVIIGGLMRLYQATSNLTYLSMAQSIAEAAIATFRDSNGVLVEWGCRGNCDCTGAQFKGAFVRNLMYLQQVNPTNLVRDYLQTNANTALANDRLGSLYGQYWQGPFESDNLNSTTQASAMDLLIAAAVA